MSQQYHYVATSQHPTAVSFCISAHFTAPEDENLIVAKINRLEIHTRTASTSGTLTATELLTPIFDVPIYGRIASLNKIRLGGDATDTVLLTTERHQFMALQYDSTAKALKTIASGDLRDRIGRPIDRNHIVAVDPLSRVVAFQFYDGLLKVLVTDKGFQDRAFNVRLEPAIVRDFTFVQAKPGMPPTLAVLYNDDTPASQVFLQFYELDIKDKVLRPIAGKPLSGFDPSAALLSPLLSSPPHSSPLLSSSVPASPLPSSAVGSVLVLGGQSVSLVPLPSAAAAAKRVAVRLQAGPPRCLLPLGPTTFLAADANGSMAVVAVRHDAPAGADAGALNLHVVAIGTAAPPSALAALGGGLIFVGSAFADSQLIRIPQGAASTGIEVACSYACLGPIVDMCVMDLDRQGQGQVVTASGVGTAGTLRVVRNGIGIEEQAFVELLGITGIWSLRQTSTAVHDRYLVQSFAHETRVLTITEDAMEELEDAGGLDLASATVHAANIPHDRILQVTPTEVRLVNGENLQLVASWTPSTLPGTDSTSRITVAASFGDHLLIALSGGGLLYVRLDTPTPTLVGRHVFPHEIACLTVNPWELDSAATTPVFGAVGLWTDVTVRIIHLVPDASGSMPEVFIEALKGEIQARSVLTMTFEGDHHLIVGMGDGHLLTFKLRVTAQPPSIDIIDSKSIALGTQPITLARFKSKGAQSVFAACDRPTVLYSSSRKLLFSNVNQSNVTYMAPFTSESFPDCLALASEAGLMIGTVDDIQKLHIRTVDLGAQPRRVIHHKPSKAVVVAVEVMMPPSADGDIAMGSTFVESGSLRLMDDVTFDTLHAFNLEENEVTTSLVCVPLALEGASSSSTEDYVVAGTAYIHDDEEEPSTGRILVFAIVSDVTGRRLDLVASRNTKGGVFSLAPVSGTLLAAGINSTIHVFDVKESTMSAPTTSVRSLVSVASFSGSTLALYLDSRGDFILVGDMMKSIYLLRFSLSDKSLTEVAAEPSCNWMTAVAMFDDAHYIGAEHHYNMFSAYRRIASAGVDTRSFLEASGEYYVGDMVNRFSRGSLVMLPMEDNEYDDSSLPTAGSAKRPRHEDTLHAVDPRSKSVPTRSMQPTLIFGTVGGAICAVINLSSGMYKFLATLQKAVNLVVPGIGGLSHTVYRSWYSDRRAPSLLPLGDTPVATRGFIDGDLIEMFLDLDRTLQTKVIQTMNGLRGEIVIENIEAVLHPEGSRSTTASLEEVLKVVEDLARLH